MGALDNVTLTSIDSVDTAHQFLRWLGERREHNAIGFDIETGERKNGHKDDALNAWRGKIRMVQVGDKRHGWAIPWETWGGVFYEAMSKYSGLVVAHNIAFESLWMMENSTWKMPWDRSHDTMIMAHVIDPTRQVALKPLTDRLVDPTASLMQSKISDAMAKNKWTWGTIPMDFPPYVLYSALDPVITMHLFDIFWKDVGPGGRFQETYEMEMQYRRICTKMEHRGARIDLEYSEQKMRQLEEYSQSVKKHVSDRYGINISSTVQLADTFEGLGAEFTKFTASGKKQMTKDELALFSDSAIPEVAALAQTVTQQRKADKLASSYFSNFLTMNEDGFVHPQIRTLGARTGRSSIASPALQTLPSGSNIVRRAFLPRTDDEVLISSDLDQVEFRLMANFSEDTDLTRLFQELDVSGGDIFTEIMKDVYRDPSITREDPRRKLIKGYIYSSIYGAGVETQARTAAVSVEDMQGVADAFSARYPGVKSFMKKTEMFGAKTERDTGTAYVTTPSGRHIPADNGRLYSLTNYKIQGTAAEIFKYNLIEIDQAGLGDYMMVPVHDEIVLSVPKDEAKDAMRVVQECMTTRDGWVVPLTAGVDGPLNTWGDKYQDA